MANVQHETLITANVHVPGYVQGSDPGGVGAGKLWTDTSGGTGFWVTKMRNIANTDWEPIGISGYSGSGQSGYSGYSGNSGFLGLSGYSGISGWSGDNPGTSGYSGYSGVAITYTYILPFIKTAAAPSGVLSVTHNLASQYNVVQICDDSDRLIVPDAVIFTDANSLSVDLTSYYAAMSGTWQVVIISGNG